jgi:hypothetical protein
MADADALGDDHTTFIKAESMPTLSRAAFQMHTFGGINSIQDGRPGFVSDEYLNATAAETTTTVLELEAAGMWERREGGYLIVAAQRPAGNAGPAPVGHCGRNEPGTPQLIMKSRSRSYSCLVRAHLVRAPRIWRAAAGSARAARNHACASSRACSQERRRTARASRAGSGGHGGAGASPA